MKIKQLICLSFVMSWATLGFGQALAQVALSKLKADGTGNGTTSLASGTLQGKPFGSATWTFFYTYSFLQDNGQGGNCDFGSGNITVTTSDGSTVNMQQAGFSCNTGAGPTSPAITDTTYFITSGTGRFSSVGGGTGHFALGFLNSPANVPGPVYVHFDGNIQLPFPEIDRCHHGPLTK